MDEPLADGATGRNGVLMFFGGGGRCVGEAKREVTGG